MQDTSQKPTNPMALTSIISAAVAWILGGLGSCAGLFLFAPLSLCTGLVFLVGSIVAVVTGYMGRNQLKEKGGLETGEGLARGGIILGIAGIVVNVLLICLAVMLVSGLTIFGPEIGNVFSDIVTTLDAESVP